MGTPWEQAWSDAMLGPTGFWATQRPGDHFRTSAGPAMAEAMLRLVRQLPARAAGSPVVAIDVGAGDGLLLQQMAERGGEDVVLIGIDVRPRPERLDTAIEWICGDALEVLQALAPVHGVVMAHEWLDEIPCPVVQVDDAGTIRLVHVDRETGRESLGAPVAGEHEEWLERWWPVRQPGARAEVGLSRDRAWQRVRDCVGSGLMLATDYDAHARPGQGTLTAFRRGRQVQPVPDGTCAITAHVMLASCADAVDAPGDHMTQRDALTWLGLSGALPAAGDLPSAAYGAELTLANDSARLRRRHGLGSFGWILHDLQPPPR